MKIFQICLICLICLFGNSAVVAQDIVFEARVDKNVVAIGENIQLSLTFQGTSDAVSQQITEPKGFSARYLGPSTVMSIVNGKMSSSISHIYVLIPLKTGKFTLGPFSAEYNGHTYQSQPISVEVVDQRQQAPIRGQVPSGGQASRRGLGQAGQMSAEEQLKDRIFVELDAGKMDVYLNETVPVTVRLYVNKLAIKDIEYPSLAAEGFSKGQFQKPLQYKKELAGLVYDVIEFKAYMYPFKAGALTLGPAKIKCNLIVRLPPSGGNQPQRSRSGSLFDDFFGNDDFFNDFFSRFETYPLELKSTELTINVKPLPQENRPPDFAGAVGEFDMQVEADPLNVKAGDPIMLRMKISGSGNFTSVNSPALEDIKDLKVYPPAAKMQDGQKVFEQVVMPLSENVSRIPAVSFSFFDPKQEIYQTVKRGPVAITVSSTGQVPTRQRFSEEPVPTDQTAKSKLAEAPENEENLGRDIIYIKDSPGDIRKKGQFLYRNKFFIWLFVVWPLIFFILFFIEKKNERLRTDIRYARMQKAYKNARRGLAGAAALSQTGPHSGAGRQAPNHNGSGQEEFYTKIFKTLQEYIGDRLHVPSGGITIESAGQYLRPKGVPAEILTKLNQVFEACDAARFAPAPNHSLRSGSGQASSARAEMPQVLRAAMQIVEDLEKVKL